MVETSQPTQGTFFGLVTAVEERADGLYADLSELESFAQRRAQANGDSQIAAIAETLRIARSFTYQCFRILRQLNGNLLGLGIAGQAVDRAAATPACCPAWSLAQGAWEWMTPPGEPAMRVQPSVLDSDGMLLPILNCPFCGAKAPSRTEAAQLKPPAVPAVPVVPAVPAVEDDEETAEVPDV